MRKKITMALAALSVFHIGRAQDSLKTQTLQEVVVSATRSEQPVIEVPRSITVIPNEIIQQSVYNSVGDLLSAQQGIYVVGAGQTPGSNQTIFMRGANSNQVVVMIDGVRITDPSSPNAAIDLSEISLTDVEQIEIIRGSHSTMYGGSAVGGVINIITRKRGAIGFHGNASLQAGTFGHGSSAFTESGNVQYNMKNGLYVNGSVFQQNVNGLNASLPPPSASDAFTTADNDDFRKTDGYLKAGFINTKWDVFAAYKRTDQRTDIDNGAFDDDDNYYLDFRRDLWEYRIGYRFSPKWSISALGSLSDLKRISENDSSVIDADGHTDRSYFKGIYNGELQTHELQANYANGNFGAVLGGGLYAENMYFDTYYFSKAFGAPFESVTNYDTIDSNATTYFGFVQGTYSLENVSVAAGTRLSHHSRSGSFWTGEISPSYRLGNSLVYASVSSGFNAPSLYQLYNPTQGFGSVTTLGNKDLEAETSLSFEAGFKKEFRSGTFFTIALFQNTVKNSIEYIYLWNGDKSIDELGFDDYRGDTYTNILRYRARGIELDGHVVFHKKIFMNANITWLKGNIKASPEDIDTGHTGDNTVQLYNYGVFLEDGFERNDLVRRPELMANAQLTFAPVKNIHLNLLYRYAGSRYDSGYDPMLGPYGALAQTEVGTYTLLDFGANWSLNPHITLSGKIENILNESYQEIIGFRTRGTSGYIKVLVKW